MDRKILLVSHEMSYTGAPRSLLQMAKVLVEEGYCVAVWTLHTGEFAAEYQKAGIEIRKIDFPNEASEKLARELEKFHLVIANTIFTACFARYAQRYVKTVLYIREAQNIPEVIKACAIDESDIARARHIVCVSEYAKKFISSRYHRQDIAVIHNYAEDCFRKSSRNKSVFRKNIIAGRRIDFLVSGTIEPRKGQDIAVHAFRQAMKKEGKRKAYLHFVGTMPEWAKEYQAGLGLEADNRIIYHGEIHDRKKLMHLYEKMDVFLVPSMDEACSLVVIEAAMLEKAVIVTENTGAKYLVDASCIVETGNSKKLADKMYEYISYPEKVQEDGKRNRLNYLEKAAKECYRKEVLGYIQGMELQKSKAVKKDSVKVSVIVPVYNVEKYLAVCLESLRMQTLSNIEIICVNDGSTDNSPNILKEYKEKDARIQIIHTPNRGYGHAMNVGMEKAVGEYIGIVEPDDYVDNKMYEILYHKAIAVNADIVKSDFYRFYGEGEKQESIYCMTAGKPENYGRVIYPEKEKDCFRYIMNTWTGIYRRTFLEKHHIRHQESPGASFQDNGFWFQGFCYVEKLFFVNRAFYYNRRDNPHSSVHNREKVYCANKEYLFIRKFLEDNPYLEKKYLYQFSLKKYHTYLFTLGRIGWEYKREYLDNFAKEFREAEQKGELCQAVFTPQEWSNLHWIMRDEAEYFEKVVKKEIRISVVIPVYNAEKYLYECFRSLEKQYFRYFEVICIDAGSTDSSLEIMNTFAGRDIRFKIYHQENYGVGAARNKGLELALGEYIVFLDSNDYFAPEMLHHAYRQIHDTEADVCVMDSWQYDIRTGKVILSNSLLQTEDIPKEKPFRIEDMKQNPFWVFTGYVWDKIYRKSFLLNNSLRFQEQKTPGDMYFSYMSLWKADKITILGKHVIHRRRKMTASLPVAGSLPWESLYAELGAVAEELEKMGLYEKYRKNYINYALHICLWNLKTLPEVQAVCLLDKLEEKWFEDLRIRELEPEDYEIQDEWEDYKRIKQFGKDGLRICREKYQKHMAETKQEAGKSNIVFRSDAQYYQYCLDEIRKSKSYKIGRAMTWLPRKIRGW